MGNAAMPGRFELKTMALDSFRIRSAQPALVAAVLACMLLSGGTAAQNGRPRGGQQPARQPPATRSSPDVPSPAAVPFRAGERLAFRVLWSKYAVHAARLELSVVERRNFFGRAAWHFRAMAHTMDTIRLLYSLDDQFDSYTDAIRLTSLQYEMYLREQGKQQTDIWRMKTAGDPAPPNVATARVLPGTRDPLGLLYALRAADWNRDPELRAPVFDGHNLYEIVARREESSGPVTVPAGQFAASRISVRVFRRGEELNGTGFSVWLAQDAARTPVLIEAEVPFGTARVELTASQF